MMHPTLFQRFFWRYLAILFLALLLVIIVTHWYQNHYFQTQREELLSAVQFWTEQMGEKPVITPDLKRQKEFEDIRLLMVNAEWQVLADTHPEAGMAWLAYLQEGKTLPNAISLERSLPNGERAIFIKSVQLRFPQTFQPSIPWFFNRPQWTLIGILVTLVVIVALILFPFVNKLSKTLEHLAGLAGEVANGHLGKQLTVSRKDELGGLVKAFNQMSRQLAEADQLNTRLIQDISHEFRSPLSRIRVFAEALKYRPENLEKNVAEIEHEIALLDRMVTDLSQASKLEALPLGSFEEISLANWAESLFGRLAQQIRSAGLIAEFEIHCELGQWKGDPQRLSQAVGNLVENAIQALGTKDNGKVVLMAEPTDGGWRVVVADNGPGIPEEDLPNVWRRFYRVSTDRSREEGGAGLGLSIVRAIVEHHGGKAYIRSESRLGTNVYLEFPKTVALQPPT